MLTVYVNYPCKQIRVHVGQTSTARRKQQKTGQRVIRLTPETLSCELARFRDKEYRFSASAEFNDMWLDVDFDDVEFEMAVLRHVQKLIGRHYSPLADVQAQMDG